MPNNTARGVFPFPLGGDTPDVPRDITALANRLAAIAVVFVQDIQANKPAANAMGGAGFLFWGTDTHILSYSDGAGWFDLNTPSSTAFLNAPGSVIFQQGVVSPGDGLVSRLSNVAVRVAAGSAWIDGDGVVGAGRYPCSWVQTDLTGIPAAGVGAKRVDRIIVRLQGQFGVTPTVERLAGGENAGQTLDARALAVAIPNGCFHVADVLVDNTGVVATTGIRSRRTFASGWRQTITRRSNAGGTNDYTSTSASWVPVDSVNMQGNVEVRNPVDLVLDGMFQGMNPLLVQLVLGSQGTQEIHFTDLPANGNGFFAAKRLAIRNDLSNAADAILAGEESSHLGWNFQWASGVGGQTMLLKAHPAAPAMIKLQERPVGALPVNTFDH